MLFTTLGLNTQAQFPHTKTFKQSYTHQQQPNGPDHACGTVAQPNDINYLENLRQQNQTLEEDFVRNFGKGSRSMPVMNIPIKAHIVRTTAGTGGLSVANLNAAIATMNSYYINANMQFYLCGGINYIDNSTYYDFSSTDETALTSPHDVSTNINIYFMNSATSGGNAVCGYAYFPGGPNHIIMVNSCATNGSTLSHEVGHFYALYHTHGPTSTTSELVNGTNCTTEGDDICDTPADPNLSGLVNTSCVYTGTGTDANGDPYAPNPNNIMSYSRKACRNLFTTGQYARINTTATTSPFRTGYSCPSSSGDDAGLDTIFHPRDGYVFCDNPLVPEVVLHNHSTTTLTAVDIKYQIDNGPLTTYNWTGSLGPGGLDTISLTGIVPPINPVFTFKAFTSAPNGNADTNNANDTLTALTQYFVAPALPYSEQLDTGGTPANIVVFDQNQDGFEWTYNGTVNGYGVASGGSMEMDNFSDDTRNTFDWMLLPTLDFTGGANIEMTFDVAYARYNASFSDTLWVLVNSDCGTSYTPLYLKGGSDLATAADITTNFTPGSTEWRTDTVDLSAYDGMTHVRIAFLNQGGYGQPIFVDNINVQAATICNLTASSAPSDATCNGGANGSIAVTAGGSSGYTYDIGAGPQGSNMFNSLGANTYSITVTDGLGCTTVTSASVGQPGSAVSASTSQNIAVNCFGGSDGSLAITASGGSPNYSYNIGSGNQSNGNFSGLNASSYTVTVTDNNGCTATTAATISQPSAALSASAGSPTNVNCFGGNDGAVTITASGGTATYSYNIGSGNQGTGAFTGLTANSYTVTVTDVNGCSATSSASITQPTSGVTASAGSPTNVTCFGGNNGAVTITASGGTASYSYNIGSGNQSNGNFTSLTANSYTVTVTDNNGCTTTTAATITQPTSGVTASAGTPTNVNCFGYTDGAVTISASGGSASYTYNIGSGNQSNGNFSGLAANSYTVTVTDNNGCTTTAAATITQPTAALSASAGSPTNVNCFGGNDGSVTVSASGGTSTYSYNIGSGNQSNGNFTGLSPNSYTVTVTDANGCSATTSASITQPAAALSASAGSPTNVNCFGGSDGSVAVTASGGTASYTYNIGSGNQSNGNFTSLTANSYTVTVTDANGCTATSTAAIIQPTPIVPAITDNGNGTATASASGGTVSGSYSYQWDASTGNQATATATGLTSGNYCVTITDDNSCTATHCENIIISGLSGTLTDINQFDVMPNPSTGEFTININFSKIKQANIQITNVLGQVLEEYNYNKQQISIPVNIAEQATGVYFVVLRSEGQSITRKITISK